MEGKMSTIKAPTYDRMMNPLLEAMRDLGGSGTIDEIADKVADVMQLSDEQLQILHDPDKGGRLEFEYRLA
ncbi:MAG: winged helix-turn-helix domain-containing protein [Chloroflexi bacterium]|nr:winged helix-turn-helix domain-containing protein [Chloroflexota bacterium]